MINSKI